MCNCTDEVWIGQPDSQRTVDVEGGIDDTGCNSGTERETHLGVTY